MRISQVSNKGAQAISGGVEDQTRKTQRLGGVKRDERNHERSSGAASTNECSDAGLPMYTATGITKGDVVLEVFSPTN